MGLLNGITQREYYQGEKGSLGDYQFTSLEDIINQFLVVYVGEGKIITKANKLDVAFHAQRALAELSFDTLKSVKSQQIDLPASLTMMLPQDYVNYTKISYADSSGIKHPLYPTKHTSNPFQIKQEDGEYFFGEASSANINPDFEDPLAGTWTFSKGGRTGAWGSTRANTHPVSGITKYYTNYIEDTVSIVNDELEFSILWNSRYNTAQSNAYGAWQRIDTSNYNVIDLKAVATSGAQQTDGSSNLICDYGVVRVGVTSTNPTTGWIAANGNTVTGFNIAVDSPTNPYPSPNSNENNFDLGYLEWNDGTTSEKELTDIDVSMNQEVWVYIQSFSPWTTAAITELVKTGNSATQSVPAGGTNPIDPAASTHNTPQKNYVASVNVIVPGTMANLSHNNSDENSSTWSSYKSTTPSENNNDDYEDDVYWPIEGNRYGLEPSHAQVNGSFYIDQRLGKIHFSSNISGKTVILDYISDSLGTDSEMQVHKFAEEAMYKSISHAILSGSSYGQALVPRLTKEKFAAIRKAKLRLSNIKLEELTQILRGKSKQIKH